MSTNKAKDKVRSPWPAKYRMRSALAMALLSSLPTCPVSDNTTTVLEKCCSSGIGVLHENSIVPIHSVAVACRRCLRGSILKASGTMQLASTLNKASQGCCCYLFQSQMEIITVNYSHHFRLKISHISIDHRKCPHLFRFLVERL